MFGLRTAEKTRLGTRVVSSVGGESVKALIPPPLPPQPAVDLTGLVVPPFSAKGII